MVKKLSLNIDYTSEFSFIGISCHLKDYRLSYFLNKKCNINLRKIEDFFQRGSDNHLVSYSVYYHKCLEMHNNFCLISNHNSGLKLISALKEFDYFLLIQNGLHPNKKLELLKSMKEIPHLLAAYEIEFSKVKNINHLLVDLELQLIENLKSYNC
jgi:hypothetical protein